MHYSIFMSGENLTVGEIAKLLGLNASALRYYESLGLVYPEKIDPWTGYRKFSPKQLYLLNFIKAMADLDLPLKALKKLTVTEDSQETKRQLKIHQTFLEKKIAEFQRKLGYTRGALQNLTWESVEVPGWKEEPESWFLEYRESLGYSFSGYALARTKIMKAADTLELELRDEQTAGFSLDAGPDIWKNFLYYRFPLARKPPETKYPVGVTLVQESACRIWDVLVEGPVPQMFQSAEEWREKLGAILPNPVRVELIHLRGTNVTPREREFLTLLRFRW